ncbi:site-specific integrase [Alphaproteobacteria bacterium]|nr:site-specific integrase [Alphaproteobacteria bacterium]
MASIRKRGKSWQVQVRSRKTGAIGKSFHRKADAERWAIEQEALMQTGQFAQTQTQGLNLGDLMQAYLEKVTPTKKGSAQEFRRITRLMREQDLMLTLLPDAKPHIFANFRDKRLKDGVRACQYDLVLLRHAWNMARVEWGWPLGDNPLSLIRMPKNNPPRERRLRAGEYEALRDASHSSRAWYLWPIVDIAIETAMRRGEILGLQWTNIDWSKQRALLPITKNGRSRWVPLSQLALEHIEQAPRSAVRVFPITDVAFRQAWDRLRVRAGITDLTFHDLRHEAISRKFESGMNISKVMAISGHRTASQLFRYVQLIDLGILPD